AAERATWPLYVSVEHGGKPVTGLDVSNFRVFLDDQSQQFGLEPLEESASVVFVVESTPRSWLYMEEIRSSIDGFLQRAPKSNWYALATFDRKLNVVVDFTKQKRQIFSALYRLPEPQDEGIATYDAIS